MAKVFQVDSGGTLTTGLVSYWKMDGSSTDFYDSNNGTDTSITYSVANGKISQGAGFNGTSSRIQVADNSNLTLGSSFSIACWINVPSLPSNNAFYDILNKYDQGSNNGGYDLRLWNDNGTQKIGLVFIDSTSTQRGGDIAYTLSTNVWVHLVAVSNTSNSLITYYINGSSVGTITNNGAVPADNTKLLNIGNFGFYTPSGSELGRYFYGKIDEIGIWSKVLTTTEISDLYNNGNGQTMIETTNTRRRLLLTM